MSWIDRLREAAYTAPGGDRLTFHYEDVARAVTRRAVSFEFPGADGTYVQEQGQSGRRYPLRVFFWGADYDTEAQAFEDALATPGTAKLEHPIYGQVDVVPFGEITRRDDLKTAANQAIIEVTLWDTIGTAYPTTLSDPGSEVEQAVEAYNAAAAESFEASLSADTAGEVVNAQSEYRNALESARAALQPVAAATAEVEREFSAVYEAANAAVATLVADPLTLAFQTSILVQAPARAAAVISDRLQAYRGLLDSIVFGDDSVASPGYDNQAANAFHINDLYASGYVSGSITSVLDNQFETKVDALSAAEEVLAQFTDLVAWRDANFGALDDIDTGETYQALQRAVALTAGFLVFISFTLKQERRVVLDRRRTIVDLAAELYGSVDDQLDFLIASNRLTGSEILELPAGREIVYYV